jgi:hypothetical protein
MEGKERDMDTCDACRVEAASVLSFLLSLFFSSLNLLALPSKKVSIKGADKIEISLVSSVFLLQLWLLVLC